MLSIYDYSDYRQYLRDYYETHKAANPAFSLRYLSQKAGINSSAFFKFLMEGTRNLTKNTVLKVCNALKLDVQEAEYFENLVFFNQAKTVTQKNFFFGRIIERQKLRNVTTIQQSQYEYFAAWYHCVVRELVTIVDFGQDFAKLGRCVNPPLTAQQARESVMLLLRLGFLKVENGAYEQTEPIVTTGYSLRDHQIINFQIEMLKKAIEAFDRARSEERLTSSSTLGISEATFAIFNRKIRELRGQLLEIARNETDPQRVYQLNVNLFPLSVRVSPKRRNESGRGVGTSA
jgi:uncharacterized protein (TIGR02147 family)